MSVGLARWIWVVAALVAATTAEIESARAEAWTLEEDALVDLALAVPVAAERRALRAGEIESEVAAGRTVESPRLSYDHRQLFADEIVTEGELALSVELDLSDRREAWLSVGEAAGASADAEAALERRLLVAALRADYFALVADARRIAAHDAWVAQLEAGLDALTIREEAGDAALWERLRLEREIANAEAERIVLAAARAETWSGMREHLVLADPDLAIDTPETPATLLPEAPEAPGDAWLAEHPALRALAAESEEASARRDTADDVWLRGWEIAAGYTYEVVGAADGHGFVAGLAIPLRFSDALAPERSAADARAARATFERGVLAATWTAAADAHYARARDLRAESVAFTGAARTDIAALSVAVDAGYRGGEIGLVELLDMARATYETEIVIVDLELAARKARLSLDALTASPGEGP